MKIAWDTVALVVIIVLIIVLLVKYNYLEDEKNKIDHVTNIDIDPTDEIINHEKLDIWDNSDHRINTLSSASEYYKFVYKINNIG